MTRISMFTRGSVGNGTPSAKKKVDKDDRDAASMSVVKGLKNLASGFNIKDALRVSGRRFKRKLFVGLPMPSTRFAAGPVEVE